MANANLERELRLLKQKIDLLLDGYQVLFLKLEQQGRMLQRLQEHLPEGVAPEADFEPPLEPADRKVVRLSERFLVRVNERQHVPDSGWDPDDKTLA